MSSYCYRPPPRRRWSPRAQLPNEKRKDGGDQLQYGSMWCRLTCYCYHTIDNQSVGGLLRSSLAFPSPGPHPYSYFDLHISPPSFSHKLPHSAAERNRLSVSMAGIGYVLTQYSIDVARINVRTAAELNVRHFLCSYGCNQRGFSNRIIMYGENLIYVL